MQTQATTNSTPHRQFHTKTHNQLLKNLPTTPTHLHTHTHMTSRRIEIQCPEQVAGC